MARQKGFLKIEGTVGGMIFYQNKDGYFVRAKGGIDPERIKTDPVFRKTRENNSEFGNAGRASKTIRQGLEPLLHHIVKGRLNSRLVSVLMRIKDLDDKHPRGKRTVAVGMQHPHAKVLLRNFHFNAAERLDNILFADYTIHTDTNDIHFESLAPEVDIKISAPFSHFSLQGAASMIDFDSGETQLALSQKAFFAMGDSIPSPLVLTNMNIVKTKGIKMNLLLLQFYQEDMGNLKTFHHEQFNVLRIL